jgi:hypothetical protein
MAMRGRNPEVDAYIAKAQPFAQPILKKLRTLVHETVPGVTEEMKWRTPHFTYKGMFAGMAAFKAHVIFGFWKHALMDGLTYRGEGKDAMGSFGCIKSLDDLPSDAAMRKLLRAAKKLNDDDVKMPARKVTPVKDRVVTVPPVFQKALTANKKAAAAFATFPYSHKKEYVEWIADAKKDETRDRRIAQAIAWIADGKGRNWKYEAR